MNGIVLLMSDAFINACTDINARALQAFVDVGFD